LIIAVKKKFQKNRRNGCDFMSIQEWRNHVAVTYWDISMLILDYNLKGNLKEKKQTTYITF